MVEEKPVGRTNMACGLCLPSINQLLMVNRIQPSGGTYSTYPYIPSAEGKIGKCKPCNLGFYIYFMMAVFK
jgi:hypothetical protein